MTIHLLYTRPNGTVTIERPMPGAISWLQRGGWWADERRGFVDEQIDLLTTRGVPPDIAARYCRAMAFGGNSEAEALAIYRDRVSYKGTAPEIIDPSDLPDRWFRTAWRRSHNGGPIWLDVEACRVQQWGRIKALADAEAAKLRPREINLGALRDAILTADEPDDIRRIWPHGLA